ncbi:MAG: GNAT family N-acetyltransferase [Microbacterium sp.]|nr:GNAT family N-acetyltransferase [Microbacterium sp.]
MGRRETLAAACAHACEDVDAEALGRVHATCWHETYDHLISQAALESVSPKRLAELWTHWAVQGPEFKMSAALVDGEIVGFVGSGPARDRDAPRTRELYFIYLWVAGDNPRAHRFYERNGFVLDGAAHTEPFLGEQLTEVRFVR